MLQDVCQLLVSWPRHHFFSWAEWNFSISLILTWTGPVQQKHDPSVTDEPEHTWRLAAVTQQLKHSSLAGDENTEMCSVISSSRLSTHTHTHSKQKSCGEERIHLKTDLTACKFKMWRHVFALTSSEVYRLPVELQTFRFSLRGIIIKTPLNKWFTRRDRLI